MQGVESWRRKYPIIPADVWWRLLLWTCNPTLEAGSEQQTKVKHKPGG